MANLPLNASDIYEASSFTFLQGDAKTGDKLQYDGTKALLAVFPLIGFILWAICAISFGIMTVASHCLKGSGVNGWITYILRGLLYTMFLTCLRSLADAIARVLFPVLPRFYLLMPVLKQVLGNIPDAILLFVVYFVVERRLTDLERGTRFKHHDKLHMLVFPLTMLILGFIDAGLCVAGKALVYVISSDASSSTTATYISAAKSLSVAYGIVHLGYLALYVVVAIEICVCAVYIFNWSGPAKTRSRTATHLCLAVAPFLLLRSLGKVFIAVFYVQLGKPEPVFDTLLEAALFGVPSVFIFLALLLCGSVKDEPQDPGAPSEGQHSGVYSTDQSPQMTDNGPKENVSTHLTALYTPPATPFSESNSQDPYPTNQQYAPPTSQQYTYTTNQQYTPVTSQQYAPTTNQQNVPTTNQHYTPTTNQRYAPATTQQYAPTTNQHYAPATSEHYAPATNQQYAPTTNQQYAPTTNQQYASTTNQQYTSSGNQPFGPLDSSYPHRVFNHFVRESFSPGR